MDASLKSFGTASFSHMIWTRVKLAHQGCTTLLEDFSWDGVRSRSFTAGELTDGLPHLFHSWDLRQSCNGIIIGGERSAQYGVKMFSSSLQDLVLFCDKRGAARTE